MEDNTQEQKDKVQITQDLGRFSQSEFVVKADPAKLQLFKCPNCGGLHFRHAGYVLPITPKIEEQVVKGELFTCCVYLCVKCKHSIVYGKDEKIHDITEYIDLNAWEKTEKEAHKATGPGGQC